MATAIATTDPRTVAPATAWERPVVRLLVDPRDIHFVRVAARLAAIVWTCSLLLFLLPWSAVAVLGPIYVACLFVFGMGRFILMLHAVSHRPLFPKRHLILEALIPWTLGPFFGQTPTSFAVHHIGMHHREDNLEGDLSSTLAYERDNPWHFLHYWARFWFFGHLHLSHYLWKNGRTRLLRRLWVGETAWLVGVGLLAWLNPVATTFVFILPLLLIRTLFMTGNWGQHAFVDINNADDPFRSATCLTNTRYNHKAYNDGYHIVHHIKPSLHWTEMATWFEENWAEFAAHNAVVFRGVADNQAVFFRLMTQDYTWLAERLVELGDPRPVEERVAFLQERARRTRGRRLGLLEFAR